jgi:hypothetical protein
VVALNTPILNLKVFNLIFENIIIGHSGTALTDIVFRSCAPIIAII